MRPCRTCRIIRSPLPACRKVCGPFRSAEPFHPERIDDGGEERIQHVRLAGAFGNAGKLLVERQVGKAVKGFKETADDLKKTVEPELNMIQQEMKMVEQDFESSMKEAVFFLMQQKKH